MSLQARLKRVNDLIKEHKRLRDKANPGSSERKRHKRELRKLNRIRRKLRKDRWKFKGSTAIVKYEIVPILEAAGVPITSRKRWQTFGNPSSDHYLGNRDADAVDGGIANGYGLADRIKRALTDNPDAKFSDYEEFIVERSHTGSKEQYRIQGIAGTHGTGPHLHWGVKRVS